MRIEPPPSPPVASGSRPPATAAADPPEEPPAVRPCCHGLWVVPLSRVVLTLRPPNSLAVVWPTRTPPPSSTRRVDHRRRVGRDPVLEHERGLGGGPARDVVELLDADGDPAERLGDVGGGRGGAGAARGRRERDRVQRAALDGAEHQLELLDAAFARRRGRRRPASRRRPATGCRSWRRHSPSGCFRACRIGSPPWTPPTGSASSRRTTRCAGSCRSRPASRPGTSSSSGAAGSAPPSRPSRAARAARSCGPPRSTSPTPTRRRSWTST